MRASEDPRVIASRERVRAIPQWRLIRLWRAVWAHINLLNRVIAEQHEQEDH